MHRTRHRLLPVILIAGLPVVGTPILLGAARTGSAPDHAGQGHPLVTEGDRVLATLFVVILAARVLGVLMRRLGQPAVVGEMLAGIVLGPSVLGVIAPHAHRWLFGDQVLASVEGLSKLGIALFLFLVGLEVEGGFLRRGGWRTAVVAQASVAVPLFLGTGVGLFVVGASAEPGVGTNSSVALFFGVAMSVTAFPVLARILAERGALGTQLGTAAVSCASVADLMAWCLLTWVVADARGSGAIGALKAAALALVMTVVMITVVRPLLAFVIERSSATGALSIIVSGLLVVSFLADRIGVHAMLGAFLFGLVCPRDSARVDAVKHRIDGVTSVVLLPLFFALVGLRLDLSAAVNLQTSFIFLLIFAVAVAGKLLGTAAAALAVGFNRGMSWRLGVLMNCRGVTEIVVLTIGLETGLLPARYFAILVFVALLSTAMTVPLLALIDRYEAAAGRQSELAGHRQGKPGDGVASDRQD